MTGSLRERWRPCVSHSIVIRTSALLLRNPLLARAVATVAWIVAALDVTDLLSPTEAGLDSLAITLGTMRIRAWMKFSMRC